MSLQCETGQGIAGAGMTSNEQDQICHEEAFLSAAPLESEVMMQRLPMIRVYRAD